MNKPIRTMAMFCMLLFLGLLANVTYLQYVAAGDLNDASKHPENRRVIEAAFSRERGAILVGRNAIAESKESDDKYDFQRTYSNPFMYAHVTGWFSFYSQSGIENTQNSVLSGDDSRLFVSRLVDLVNNASPKGGTVELTLDPDAQKAAFDGLFQNPELGNDVQGAVVALEPSTGKILAMVSAPTFNPNKLASHDLESVEVEDKKLNDRADEPKLNRAISTTLPPGSTFKLVTAAAALETGDYDADSMVPGGPSYRLPGTNTSIGNGGRACGTDKISMTQALEQSCNTTFLALANELGQDKLRRQAEAFGFNDTSLEDLKGQAQSVFPTEEISDDFLAKSGIGQQDVRATPLQMAMVVSGIVNDGVVMRPYLVDEVRSPDLDVLDKTSTEELSEAVGSDSANELRKMMVAVVENGTAGVAAIPDAEVGAKTGTAENCSACNDYAWFVSYAKKDGKDVAVAVMLQKVQLSNAEIAGGKLAGPIAKSVMEAVID
ncbi:MULTISPECIES: peptidoglycan D,D-transpeptidase FtsI family protein [unclassified Nocardioides]|uniref:peptidoglycan D,D-transpeptidase FtsI family protein n=1 Tax=unclassified Nocardioides TaxID=2615069 RepID=UPI0006F75ED9|nr:MULTISPECIES: penicillin-binding protein 2 [unclassified Nocardioides]KQY57446.1 cell division protein FtsI [Nocardioides sp. Root140]KQZ76188.1 cell division protein FtsI [Nocardioides sp. Root151]KRF20359.1 cell division protein FtsI [Nocardioides sp. Soil796]